MGATLSPASGIAIAAQPRPAKRKEMRLISLATDSVSHDNSAAAIWQGY
jgi:hypothetical protein